jgi:hypothetical protein
MLREQSSATENVMREEKRAKEAQINQEERLAKDFAGGQRRLVEGYHTLSTSYTGYTLTIDGGTVSGKVSTYGYNL